MDSTSHAKSFVANWMVFGVAVLCSLAVTAAFYLLVTRYGANSSGGMRKKNKNNAGRCKAGAANSIAVPGNVNSTSNGNISAKTRAEYERKLKMLQAQYDRQLNMLRVEHQATVDRLQEDATSHCKMLEEQLQSKDRDVFMIKLNQVESETALNTLIADQNCQLTELQAKYDELYEKFNECQQISITPKTNDAAQDETTVQDLH